MKKKFPAKNTGGDEPVRSIILKILIVLISCLLLWDVAGPYGLWTRYRLQQKRGGMYAANMQLALENSRIEENLQKIKTDRQYQVKVIRKKLGWVKNNEILFKFISEKQETR